MAIDTSIYGNIQPVQAPDMMDSAKNAMTLSQMGMQNREMQLQMQTQQAMRQAYADNIGADGQLNQQGFVNAIGKVNPQAAMQYSKQASEMGKLQAESQSAKMDALGKIVGNTLPAMDYLAKLPEDQRAQQFNGVMKQLEAQGIPMHNIPRDAQGNYLYDPGHFAQGYSVLQNTAQNLANMEKKSTISKNVAETNAMPVKIASDMFGSRSPNAELTSQYDKQVGSVRNSQMAMQQMIDNYNHPSPQGDASLVLNAFKIKFPTAPDVNSLEELTKSQSVPDSWKQQAAHALQGGLDQGTRDNLMRDAASTYRANYDSYQGIKKRADARAQFQGVNDPTLTYEPAIEGTYKNAMALQDKIGPYVPPAERQGLGATLSKIASKIAGVSKPDTSDARNEGVAYAGQKSGPALSPSDTAALQWMADPKNQGTPDYFSVKAKLKAKGLLK